MINQALYNYVAVNGELEEIPLKNSTYQENFAWVNSHILPYIKYREVKRCKIGSAQNVVCTYLYNGDSFSFASDVNGGDIIYAINHDVTVGGGGTKKKFQFQFYKKQRGNNIQSKKFIEPYTYDWDGTMNNLKNHSDYGCSKTSKYKVYCAKYIQLNGWKIPADYPW